MGRPASRSHRLVAYLESPHTSWRWHGHPSAHICTCRYTWQQATAPCKRLSTISGARQEVFLASVLELTGASAGQSLTAPHANPSHLTVACTRCCASNRRPSAQGAPSQWVPGSGPSEPAEGLEQLKGPVLRWHCEVLPSCALLPTSVPGSIPERVAAHRGQGGRKASRGPMSKSL